MVGARLTSGWGALVVDFGDGALVDVRLRVADALDVFDELDVVVVVVVVVERVVVLELRVVVVVLVDTTGRRSSVSVSVSPKTVAMAPQPQHSTMMKAMIPTTIATTLFWGLPLLVEGALNRAMSDLPITTGSVIVRPDSQRVSGSGRPSRAE